MSAVRWLELKTDPAMWHAVESGRKTFEIRFNDRNYQPGDGLLLRKTRYTGQEMKDGKPLEYVGEPLRRMVTHVMTGPLYGLAEGWAILSIAAPAEEPWKVFRMNGHQDLFLVKRETPNGAEYLQTPSGFPAHFRSAEKARAAIAKAEAAAAVRAEWRAS